MMSEIFRKMSENISSGFQKIDAFVLLNLFKDVGTRSNGLPTTVYTALRRKTLLLANFLARYGGTFRQILFGEIDTFWRDTFRQICPKSI